MLLRFTLLIQYLFRILFVVAQVDYANTSLLLSDPPHSVIQDHASHSLAKRGGPYGDALCKYRFNKEKQILKPDTYPYWIITENWEERNSVCRGRFSERMATVCEKTYDYFYPSTVGHLIWTQHTCPPSTKCYTYPRPGQAPNIPRGMQVTYAFCMWYPGHHIIVLHPGFGNGNDLHCSDPETFGIAEFVPKDELSRIVLLRAEASTPDSKGSTPLMVPELHVEVSTTGLKGPYNRYASQQWASTAAIAYVATVTTIFVRFCVIAKPWQLKQYTRIGLSYSAVLASTAAKLSDFPEYTGVKPVVDIQKTESVLHNDQMTGS